MKSDTPLDYAVFQLSPKRSRCELFVSSFGNTEKLASGLVKPFVTHLKVAEEQVALAVQSIKLDVEKCKNVETWFTKGTLERFVRFVSTPEILELVNTFDAEMSQLEGARRIYSQGMGDQLSGALGGDGTGATAAADATKKELLRAIDVRLVAVRQDLTTACSRASAAGFNPDTVSELQLFADRFGAHRLNDACSKFISLYQRRPDLIDPWKTSANDRAVRSSTGSDMSIDDPTEDISGYHHQSQRHNHPTGQEPDASQKQQSLGQLKSSTCQQPKSSSSSVAFPLRRSQSEKREERESNGGGGVGGLEKETAATESIQASQPSRRLSVADRISLFENKQKESSGGSGGKPVVGKSVELRRLSSDLSSAPTPVVVEKAVLRRWSGVSDMSIDLSGEKKDIESPLSTPSSSSVSQSKSGAIFGPSEEKDRKGLNDTATSVRIEVKNTGLKKDHVDSQTRVGGGSSVRDEVGGFKAEGALKDQTAKQSQFRSFPDRGEPSGLTDQVASEVKFKVSSGVEDRGGDQAEISGLKDQAAPQTLFEASAQREAEGVVNRASSGELHNRVEDVGLSEQPITRSRFGASVRTTVDAAANPKDSLASQIRSGQSEAVPELKFPEVSLPQNIGIEGDSSARQHQWKPIGEVEEVGKKKLALSEKQPTIVDNTGSHKMMFQKQVFAPELIKKSQGRIDESSSTYGNTKFVFPGKKVPDGQESFNSISTTPGEQVQRVRQSKGNQELNDELQMKANELEKLFAEHKLRVPGDQSISSRRSKPSDIQMEPTTNFPYRKPAAEMTPPPVSDKTPVCEPTGSSSTMAKSNSSSLMRIVENQEFATPDSLKQNFSELYYSDDSRGKFYDNYMQKRDAKLREEWDSKRAEKEAKMKAMQDSLERSREELKAKLAGSANSQDSRRRAEKFRSFNLRSAVKMEQPMDYGQSEEDEDLSEFPGQKSFGQDRFFSETSLGDGTSRSTNVKKLFPNRNSSSSTPRTSAAPIPRFSVKASNSSSGRRRTQPENPLAQSVPNFSDLRKENTKPYSGVSKTTTRSQPRNYARSKSTSDETPLVKEEKPRRSHSLRKSTASPAEFKELPPLISEGVVLAPLKYDKELSEQSIYERFPKNVESKPFLRKGNGIGPGAGASVVKLKASMASEVLKNEEESDDLVFEPEELVDMVKEEEEEEYETRVTEDCANIDNGKPRMSQEFDKSADSGSENGDVLRSLSQVVDTGSIAEMPAAVPSVFHTMGSVQDSPGESPVSWNSRMHNSFSYPQETSDIDASVDSPMGSPASWNSHSLAQTDADAARMRKKWGSAHKPIIVANSSHNQSRKDMTKGFKRLLKFGRKSRGTETLVDWISATTSEGDDDTEDGRDPSNRSSEDLLRKSRMGFLQSHHSDEGFNESEYEQVQAMHSSIPAPPANFKLREEHLSGSSLKAPRSFFSLSSFRSKGSDSKPR